MPLSARDKTPKSFGCDFHHTNPQRRVPCVLGDMLAPLSADDIPPITPEAMASVQAALKLLADLIGDCDLSLFLGDNDVKREEHRVKACDILLTAKGLAGILRVEEAPQVPEHEQEDEDVDQEDAKEAAKDNAQDNDETDRLVAEMSALPAYQGWAFFYEYPGYFCYSHPTSPYRVFCTPDFSEPETVSIQTQDNDGGFYEEFSSDPKLPREGRTGAKIFELVRPTLDKVLVSAAAARATWAAISSRRGGIEGNGEEPGIELHVALTAAEVSALKLAGEHVRVHMAHEHSWKIRDTAMGAIGKVLAAARAAQS